MNYTKSKINYDLIIRCLDNKIKNIHPELREKLILDLQNIPESYHITKCRAYVIKLLEIPALGIHTKHYWLARGWSEAESYIKSKQYAQKEKISPYSREFWTSKINPDTGKNYTKIEADYERNSRRPIRKEYWIKKGYTEEEAEKLCIDEKNKNNKSGAKKSKEVPLEIRKKVSKRCIEYWLNKGYSLIDAKEELAKQQATFTLGKCIQKYGEVEGKHRWLERQEKWQNTLNLKSDSEKEEINRKKATKINYATLWNQDLNVKGILYLLKITGSNEEFYKIGVTTKSVYSRYGGNISQYYDYEILQVIENTINQSFILEQKVIKENTNISYVPKQKFEGWTECFYEKPIINN